MLLCKMSSIRVSIPTIFVGCAFKSLVLRGFLGTGAKKKKKRRKKERNFNKMCDTFKGSTFGNN